MFHREVGQHGWSAQAKHGTIRGRTDCPVIVNGCQWAAPNVFADSRDMVTPLARTVSRYSRPLCAPRRKSVPAEVPTPHVSAGMGEPYDPLSGLLGAPGGRDQKSFSTSSPPAMVTRASSVLALIEDGSQRTLPSTSAALAPTGFVRKIVSFRCFRPNCPSVAR